MNSKTLRRIFLAMGLAGVAAILFAVFTLSGYPATVSSQTNFTVENNIDRPGGDYQDFDLPEANYKLCENACAKDVNCRSYTYVRPQGGAARCWLKNTVPTAGTSACCVSGVKKCGGDEPEFAGDWYAGEWGNITFSQECNKVSGSYTRGNGTINGVAVGARLDATWQQDGRIGTVFFIARGAGTMEGRYCEGKGCNPEQGTYFSGRRR